MNVKKISDYETNESYILFDQADIEFVNPIEHYRGICNQLISKILNESTFNNNLVQFNFLDLVNAMWYLKYEKFNNTEIPQELISILSANKKKSKLNC